ncbi:unnamed protein product [Ectocarpus sp. CCAP 1310/34]|nr:unnamed protein product [Ectocarpus sp. CCAP 1310/34]
MVRCLLADSGLLHFLWGELFMAASYLSNRAPHSALDNVAPFKALHGKEAYLGHLRAIGARALFTWRPIPTSLMLVPGKDGWLATASTANLFGLTTRKRGEYARAATSSSSRHRRPCRNRAWGTSKVPGTFEEAMELAEADLWKQAAETEIKSLQELKRDCTYKARLVALGWNQVPEKDCGGTFAPVCRLQSVRMVFAIAAEMDWEKTIDLKLIELGCNPLKSDSCVYIYKRNHTIVIITLYVDDLVVIGGNIEVIEAIKTKLMEQFQMSVLGNVSLVLGMQVTRDGEHGTLTITQADYTRSILARFGMEECKPTSIPSVGSELSTEQPTETVLNKEKTQSQLARVMSKAAKAHMGAAKHLLRGTQDFCITYKRGGFKLTAFSDANWESNPDNARSTSSYMIMMSKAPVSFKTGLQDLTVMSTMEAELLAAALTMKEAVFCSNMMTELGFGQQFGQVPLYINNTATLHVIGNQAYSSRTKHIALLFFCVRELVKEGAITIH